MFNFSNAILSSYGKYNARMESLEIKLNLFRSIGILPATLFLTELRLGELSRITNIIQQIVIYICM